MRFEVPHPIPYQGSKRLLAPAILSFVPKGRFRRLIEPFAGSAAVTLAAAQRNLFSEYVIGDILKPLTDIWLKILEHPADLCLAYSELWEAQMKGEPIEYFNRIRAEFNHDHDPAKLLFLLARCVKNAVRFNPKGQFNQSADKRRRGTRPETLAKEIRAAHRILRGHCEVICGDFRKVLESVGEKDLVYMDPPYQGTSQGRDSRYAKSVDRGSMIRLLEWLNGKRVQFLLSYDGQSGSRIYGQPMPAHLNMSRILLEVGRSSQATLNGRNDITVESLYLSSGFGKGTHPGRPLPLTVFATQPMLFS